MSLNPVITIGSDPEYAVHDTFYGCQIGVYSIPELMINSKYGNASVDGHHDIGEIRPRYAITVREHIHNVRGLIYRVHKGLSKSSDYARLKIHGGEWIFENDRNPERGDGLGGHIHIGLADKRKMSTNLLRDIVTALDYWVAPVVMLTEPMPSAKYRRRGDDRGIQYGMLHDYRTQNWGVEYRVLGSWLTSPRTAFAVLSYTYCVADAVVRNQLPRPPSKAMTMAGVESAYKAFDMVGLRKHYHIIKSKWREFPAAHDRDVASGLGTLASLINLGHRWRESDDLRKHWLPENYVTLPEQQYPQAQLAQTVGRGVSPVLWPGPGVQGHGIFSAVFRSGHRPLLVRHYSILVGVCSFPDYLHIDILTKHSRYGVQNYFPGARVQDTGDMLPGLGEMVWRQTNINLADGGTFFIFDTRYLDRVIQSMPDWADWLYNQLKRAIQQLCADELSDRVQNPASLDEILLLDARYAPSNAVAFDELNSDIHQETRDKYIWHYTQLQEGQDDWSDGS